MTAVCAPALFFPFDRTVLPRRSGLFFDRMPEIKSCPQSFLCGAGRTQWKLFFLFSLLSSFTVIRMKMTMPPPFFSFISNRVRVTPPAPFLYVLFPPFFFSGRNDRSFFFFVPTTSHTLLIPFFWELVLHSLFAHDPTFLFPPFPSPPSSKRTVLFFRGWRYRPRITLLSLFRMLWVRSSCSKTPANSFSFRKGCLLFFPVFWRGEISESFLFFFCCSVGW